jgi:hypothetical protein
LDKVNFSCGKSNAVKRKNDWGWLKSNPKKNGDVGVVNMAREKTSIPIRKAPWLAGKSPILRCLFKKYKHRFSVNERFKHRFF